jgi:alpha-beta hydrolase superfamily lysophospholipase
MKPREPAPVQPRMPRLLTRPLALLAIALALGGAFAGCASLDEWQRQAIFNPARDNPRWFSEPIGGTAEYDVALANGQRVHMWYVEQTANAATAPTVLYLHGARWNMNGSVFRIARWHELGFNVLAIDYRGFGKSTEILPSEETATEDARTAFEELKRQQPDPTRRYIYGHSLGGALAVDLAARELDEERGAVAGVIIESTFTSIPDLVRGMKWGWVPGISLAVTQPFDSMAKMPRVRVPLLVLHGTADGVVPHTMADELYAAAGSSDKTLVKIDGGTHSGSSRTGGAAYRDAVLEFVRRTGSTTTVVSTH